MITMDGESLSPEEVYHIAAGHERARLSEDATGRIRRSRERLMDQLSRGKAIYGVNTGFGSLLNVSVPRDRIIELQKNLIRSHASGVGDPLPEEHVRALMAVRANNLARGYSGVRVELVQLILDFLNNDVTPVVPRFGSVGASGDLAPLAHVALTLMGEGEVVFRNERMKSADALSAAGMKPLEFTEKEGVAFINGTTAISGILSVEIHRARRMIENSTVSAALSFEALKGTDRALREWAVRLRPHKGQEAVARGMRRMLEGSAIVGKSSITKVQDAYSLRCIPQVQGAVLDTIDYAYSVLKTEINSVTDNPLVGEDEIVSAGNFHGEPVALVCDFAAIALTDLGNIIERRIARLVDTNLSGLPPFLVEDSGYNSGYMIPQYTAAALCNRNKTLSTPSTADTIPTSANQEDHVSMGTNSAIKLSEIVRNLRDIVAIEYLLAAQGLEFADDQPSPLSKSAWNAIRRKVPRLEKDRAHYVDMEAVSGMIENGEILEAVGGRESLFH